MTFIKAFEAEVRRQWNNRFLGTLKGIDLSVVNISENITEIDVDKSSITLMLSSLSAAISTQRLIGAGKDTSATFLKSIKSRMDTSASDSFGNYWKNANEILSIAASEGKDERGNVVEDSLKKVTNDKDSELSIAVDVVDGTTLAAKGLNGAYSIAAGAKGLRTFPDMQAYAIGGPIEVLDELDFSNKPEDEVIHFISLLSKYYGKMPSELRIVTHSYDTGTHHSQLISAMKSLGVQVIIPNPVIVEPPYVASMALRTAGAPDGMIGVFGLPEIVINALLCITITEKQELRFRIASNEMLFRPEETDLDLTFAFSEAEKENLESNGLDVNHIYGKLDLAESLDNACFTAIALTDDPVLGLSGISRLGDSFKVETLFSCHQGVTLKMVTRHELNNPVAYIARNQQKIDDISAVIPLLGSGSQMYLEDVIKQMQAEGFNFLNYSPVEDLHITAFEYGIHYGGYSGDLKAEKEKIAKHFLEHTPETLTFELGDIGIMGDSIICKVSMSQDDYRRAMSICLPEEKCSDFQNVNSMPMELHVTLARFTEYVGKKEIEKLNCFLAGVGTPTKSQRTATGELQLVHISLTPYNGIRRIF